MSRSLRDFARIEFAPPRYLSLPTAGIDISASGVKMALLKETHHGLILDKFAEEPLPTGTIENAEIADHATLGKALATLVRRFSFGRANITLSESRGYLFETAVEGKDAAGWCTQVEQHLDEYIPLTSTEAVFDVVRFSEAAGERTQVIGVGYPRRVVENTIAAFEDAGVYVRAIEAETFALPRALLKPNDTDTVLIVDIGKASTKLLVASRRLPRFATTVDVGGNEISAAAQKYFSVTEEESKKIKAEVGLVGGPGKEEYQAEVLRTVSIIRDEIIRRLDYWQSRGPLMQNHAPVTRIIVVGGNATVRGLPEFLSASLSMPVELGDVFINLASKDEWLPPVDFTDSLAYGTAIGLALREYE
jgi:type IV pilus assembly protein PilM